MINKLKIVESILKKLNEARANILESYKSNKKASIEAPSAMQSHSDVSKSQFGTLADDAMKRLQDIDSCIFDIEKVKKSKSDVIQIGALAEVSEDGEISYFLYFTPDGGGGLTLKEAGVQIKTISINSPIGKAFISKKSGAEIELYLPAGARKLKILFVQ